LPSKYLLILFVLGIVCMIGSNVFSKSSSTKKLSTSSSSEETSHNNQESTQIFGSTKKNISKPEDYKDRYEDELTNILENMSGVKKVQVVLTLASSEKKIYEKNKTIHTQKTEEKDKQGGKRNVEDK